jgi:hypothetical protein
MRVEDREGHTLHLSGPHGQVGGPINCFNVEPNGNGATHVNAMDANRVALPTLIAAAKSGRNLRR